MMVCHLMEPLTISLAFSRFTRHTAEHISCQTRLRIMKPVRRLVISSYPGVLLETTADARYMDMVENELLNGVLPGISLDGTRYFYTQACAVRAISLM